MDGLTGCTGWCVEDIVVRSDGLRTDASLTKAGTH